MLIFFGVIGDNDGDDNEFEIINENTIKEDAVNIGISRKSGNAGRPFVFIMNDRSATRFCVRRADRLYIIAFDRFDPFPIILQNLREIGYFGTARTGVTLANVKVYYQSIMA